MQRGSFQGAVDSEKLDSKYLLRTSDPSLSPEDIALGYKQLAEVERGWRNLKHVLDLRPVYQRKEERIWAHVLLCWLALLLARVAESKTGDSWPALRRELERLQVGTFEGQAGFFRKRMALTAVQKTIFRKLYISEPPEMQEIRRQPRLPEPLRGLKTYRYTAHVR